MALTDKNIVITPNNGQAADPQIVFSGASDLLSAQNIILKVYPADNGTLSFEGSAGQLFSIGNTMSGTIYSVNDVSGIPSLEVIDTGLVKLAEFSGNVIIGTGTDNGTDKLQVNGSVSATQLKSTVATGTSPLTVASTTVVTNLNADKLDGQDGAYYQNASNINAGTIGDAYLPASISSDITGNAATATKLATSRTINGVAFDGSANITISDSTKLALTGGTLTGSLTVGGAGFIALPPGTTLQRPVSPVNGMLRYNTDTNLFEGYANGAWLDIGSGSGGAVAGGSIYENNNTVFSSYTISTGKNALSAGPMIIADGVTVTIPDNSTWVIV